MISSASTLGSLRLLDEDTVYWEPPERDGLGGYEWEYPIQFKARWQFGPVITYDPANGSEVVSRVMVWVSENVMIGGYLWRGTINDLQTIFKPLPVFEDTNNPEQRLQDIAAQIVNVRETRSIVTKDVLRRAFLQ